MEISVGSRCVSSPDVFRSDCRIDRVRSRCLLHACNASCIYMHITDDAAGARAYACSETGYDATRVIHTGCTVVHVCTRSRIHAHLYTYAYTRAHKYVLSDSKIGLQLGLMRES